MYLTIDGHCVKPEIDQSLLDMIRTLGMTQTDLASRPLAAKIAGEVFTLNYIPVRSKDVTAERPSIRRAMAASEGVVRLLRYEDTAGKECYIRTAQFLIFLSLRQLWPQARAKMNCTLGSSVYIQVSGADDFSCDVLKQKMKELEDYMKELSTDVTEMIEGASPEEKTMLKNKMQVLMQKIN